MIRTGHSAPLSRADLHWMSCCIFTMFFFFFFFAVLVPSQTLWPKLSPGISWKYRVSNAKKQTVSCFAGSLYLRKVKVHTKLALQPEKHRVLACSCSPPGFHMFSLFTYILQVCSSTFIFTRRHATNCSCLVFTKSGLQCLHFVLQASDLVQQS